MTAGPVPVSEITDRLRAILADMEALTDMVREQIRRLEPSPKLAPKPSPAPRKPGQSQRVSGNFVKQLAELIDRTGLSMTEVGKLIHQAAGRNISGLQDLTVREANVLKHELLKKIETHELNGPARGPEGGRG